MWSSDSLSLINGLINMGISSCIPSRGSVAPYSERPRQLPSRERETHPGNGKTRPLADPCNSAAHRQRRSVVAVENIMPSNRFANMPVARYKCWQTANISEG